MLTVTQIVVDNFCNIVDSKLSKVQREFRSCSQKIYSVLDWTIDQVG